MEVEINLDPSVHALSVSIALQNKIIYSKLSLQKWQSIQFDILHYQ